jgi:transcriptional regulator with XRE-family HTH domain
MERKTIVRIERGLHSPVLDRVFLLADALQVSPADLFLPQPSGEPPTQADPPR